MDAVDKATASDDDMQHALCVINVVIDKVDCSAELLQ